MNAKKAKALRKAVANIPNEPVSFSPPRLKFYTDLSGNRIQYYTTGTMIYSDVSRRRIYQDAKRIM